MLYMVIFTYDDPGKKNEVLKRRSETKEKREKLMAKGLKIVGQWSYLAGGKVFTLCDVDDPKLIAAICALFNDLGKYEIIPVLKTDELVEIYESQ